MRPALANSRLEGEGELLNMNPNHDRLAVVKKIYRPIRWSLAEVVVDMQV